jgi:CheY-like chemotaxis protein
MENKVILLVEDDYVDVESIRRVFKKLNVTHTLHVAHNGVDALNLLTREVDQVSPDIILLDINMPKMNGLEFLGIVRSYYSLKNIKIFIITTSGEEYEQLVAQNLGVTGYIIKPLSFKDKPSGDALKLKAELLGEAGQE